jgi:VanZ family protein
MKKFFSIWGPVLFYAAAIFVQSAFPQIVSVKNGWDKVVHFFGFALLGFLAARSVFLSGNFGRTGGVILGALLAAIWGVLDEFHQSFVPGRTASAGDAAADTLGAIVGAVLFIYLGVLLYRSNKLYPKGVCGNDCSI